MRGAATTVTRKPRVDAAHNRRHIVAVAHAAFAAEGLELPMREIARRAGLGVATLYRHFPSRPDLIGAVLAEQAADCGAAMRAALDDPDPWRALSGLIRRFADYQLRARGLNDAVLGSHAAGLPFAEQRRAHARGLERLVERARRYGGRPARAVGRGRTGRPVGHRLVPDASPRKGRHRGPETGKPAAHRAGTRLARKS